jgi:hypothetical protein
MTDNGLFSPPFPNTPVISNKVPSLCLQNGPCTTHVRLWWCLPSKHWTADSGSNSKSKSREKKTNVLFSFFLPNVSPKTECLFSLFLIRTKYLPYSASNICAVQTYNRNEDDFLYHFLYPKSYCSQPKRASRFFKGLYCWTSLNFKARVAPNMSGLE